MSGESFDLSWKEFNENSSATIRNLYQDQHFSDVILATEDDGELMCHKVVLASSSNLFRRMLLRRRSQSHPVIFLRGVKMMELEALIKFVYLGETSVLQSDVKSFLQIAEMLEINGLGSSLLSDDTAKQEMMKPNQEQNNLTSKQKGKQSKRVKFSLENNQNHVFDDSNENVMKDEEDLSLEESDSSSVFSNIICSDCNTEFPEESNLKDHKRRVHHDKSYHCDDCDKIYTRMDNLTRHRRLAHGQVIL